MFELIADRVEMLGLSLIFNACAPVAIAIL